MSWRPWKAKVAGRTEEVNELEERKFSPLSRFDIDKVTWCSRIWEKEKGKGAKHVVKLREEEAEKKRIKDEKRRQREAATKRPQWAIKRSLRLRSKRIRGMEVVLPQGPVVEWMGNLC